MTEDHRKHRSHTGPRAHLCMLLSAVLVTCVGVLACPAQVHAFDVYRTPDKPDEPPPPPPPPPPCKNGGSECCPQEGSDGTVSYLTGAEHIIRTDLAVNAPYPIEMKRMYISTSKYDSPLGYGWAFNHNMRLFEYPDNSVVIRTGCGVNYKYIYSGGSYQAGEGGFAARLGKYANGGFSLRYNNGELEQFDSQGNLFRRYDAAGNYLEYTYDNRGKLPLTGSSPYAVDPSQAITVAYNYRLTKIESYYANGAYSGEYVLLSYDETTGRLTSIVDRNGRQVRYEHDLSSGVNRGNLERVTGLEGVVSTYRYEDFVAGSTTQYQDYHNVTEIRDSQDATPISLTYDRQDRVVSETIGYRQYSYNWAQFGTATTVTETNTDDQGLNAVTATRQYTFNGTGYLTSITDGNGNRVEYQLDGYGNRIQERYYAYDAASGSETLIKTIDRENSTDSLKQSETITLDSGEVITTTWTYTSTRPRTKETWSSLAPSKRFKTATLYYFSSSSGEPTTILATRRYREDDSYLDTSYTYNANGDLLTTTYPDGHVVVNEYGAAYEGKYVTRSYHLDAQGNALPDLEETYQYDSRGNRTRVTDARGNSTLTTYDDKNRRRTVTNALGHLTTYVYDVNDNLVNIIRDRSAPGDQLDDTRLSYDGRNRLIRIERGNASDGYQLKSTLRYDSAGNVIARGDAYGNETRLRYDLENRLTRITDAQGNYIEYTLNALGQRIATNYYNALGAVVRASSAVFDDLDRQQQLIGALGQTTTFTYDAVGNRISATDAENRPATVYAYDTLSRLTGIQDADGNTTQYQYDDRDRLRLVTDPRGFTTEYVYNDLGQLTTLISPDTGTTRYIYDLAGNRITQTDARGITVTYGYDELNRITSKTYPEPTPGAPNPLNVTYTYDERANGLGKLTGMSDAEGTTEYDYDTNGNLTEKRYTPQGGATPYITQYDYDNNDRLIRITTPSGRSVEYTRNALGQVTSITTTPRRRQPADPRQQPQLPAVRRTGRHQLGQRPQPRSKL